MDKINLLEPVIPPKSKEYVNDCLDTGWLSYSGSYVKQLENQVKDFVRTKSAVAMGNGTGALWVALKTFSIGPGDFVVVPSMTFVATVNAVIQTGATPVFVDCNNNLQIDINFLRDAIEKLKPKAIIPVHILGNLCDMDTIKSLAYNDCIPVIEDAAQALGSIDKCNCYAGTRGTVGMYSFSFNKLIAAGQGGMLVTREERLGNHMKYFSLQSKDNAEMYVHDEAGFNMGMSNINAALACGQMENIDETLKQKRRVRDKYVELLGKENMYYQEGGNGWLNAYKTNKAYKEVSLRCKRAGIQVRPLFYPNHKQTSFNKYPYFGNHMAENKYKTTVCIPSSPNLTDEQIQHVVKSIRGDK